MGGQFSGGDADEYPSLSSRPTFFVLKAERVLHLGSQIVYCRPWDEFLDYSKLQAQQIPIWGSRRSVRLKQRAKTQTHEFDTPTALGTNARIRYVNGVEHKRSSSITQRR